MDEQLTRITEEQSLEHRAQILFGESYISKIDVINFRKRFAVFNKNIYNKSKFSDDSILEILNKLDELEIHDIDTIALQMRRSRELNKIKEDREVEHIYDILFILAQIIPALGLISGAILVTNIFLVPLIILLYSLLYLSNNIKVDGFFNKKNIWLFLTFSLASIVAALSLTIFFGFLTFLEPVILPAVVLLNVILFIYATYREIIRDRNARRYMSIKINRVLDEYYTRLPDAKKAIAKIDYYIKQTLNNDNHENKDDNIMIAKLNILRFFLKSLVREYCNNVRTIKAPWTKISHLQEISNIQKYIAINIINEELKQLDISVPDSLTGNLENYASGKEDDKFIRFLREYSINTDEIKNLFQQNDVYGLFGVASQKIKKYLYRDIPYYIFNMALITIGIIVALPFIPVTLSSVIMITIASIVSLYALINISLRVRDFFFPQKYDDFFSSIEMINGIRVMNEFQQRCKKTMTKIQDTNLVDAPKPKK